MTDLAQASLWSLVLLPALTGGLLALTTRAERVAGPVSLASAALVVGLSVVVALHRPSVAVPFMVGAELSMAVDGLAALVLPTLALVTFVVLVFATGDIHESRARFHGLMLLFAAGALLTVTAATLPTLLLAWELMGATSYALIGFWWHEDHRVSGGLTAFLTTRTADLGLYVAAGILVAALGKAAQLPFSFWLSRAMAGPSPVSALLHSAAMVAMGGYLLLRVDPLLASTGWAGPLTAWIGAATAVLLGAVALAQRDLKQLLAASTAAQLGFVVMAAGLSSISGGAAHLVSHAATKALLFLAAGAWLGALGTRTLTGLQGVARRWPTVGWSATVGAVALAGIAPLSLWATKDAVLTAALAESAWLYAAGLVASVLSAGYAGKILVVIWRPVPAADLGTVVAHHDLERPGSRSVSTLEKAPLLVLAVGAAGLGVLALGPVADAVARALGEGGTPHPAPIELVVSAVLALATVAAVLRWQVPEPGWATAWLGLETAARTLVVRPTLRLAGALARFDDEVLDRATSWAPSAVLTLARGAARLDDRILDRGVDLVATTSLRAADGAARGDVERVDGLVEWFATRLRRAGELARRPQTGQLHHYYLQAGVVVAAGIALLVTVR